MDLLNRLKPALTMHNDLVSEGMPSELATDLIFNSSDYSFKPITMDTHANYYRQKLTNIANGITVDVDRFLNKMTITEIEELVKLHHCETWTDPDNHTTPLTLVGITKDGEQWWFEFTDEFKLSSCSYQLKDCFVQDALSFLDAIDKVIN